MSEESLRKLRNAARLLEAEVGNRVELSKLRFVSWFILRQCLYQKSNTIMARISTENMS